MKSKESKDGFPILRAISEGNIEEVLKRLCEEKLEVNMEDEKTGRTPLHMAVEKNSVPLVKKLLEQGCALNKQNKAGNCALHFATRSSHCEIVEALIEEGANVDIENNEQQTVFFHPKKNNNFFFEKMFSFVSCRLFTSQARQVTTG